MGYGRRRGVSSFLEGFTLNPLPYPVLLILALVSVFLGLSWYCSFESVLEDAEEKMGWALMAAPISLLILVQWLSSMENPGDLFGLSPYDRRRRSHRPPSGGSSPWGVAALIILSLILLQYQSTFRDSWSV